MEKKMHCVHVLTFKCGCTRKEEMDLLHHDDKARVQYIAGIRTMWDQVDNIILIDYF